MADPRMLLLDRDGTVIQDKHYLCDPNQVAFEVGAVDGLRALAAQGWRFVLVTNQSGVGRGYFSLEQVAAVHRRLRAMLEDAGIVLSGIYVCPHAPEAGCRCRKPAPGLVEQAARELGFDPRQAVVVGDKLADVALAQAVGARPVLVRTGQGRQAEAHVAPGTLVVEDLRELAVVLSHPPSSP